MTVNCSPLLIVSMTSDEVEALAYRLHLAVALDIRDMVVTEDVLPLEVLPLEVFPADVLPEEALPEFTLV